MKEKSKRKFLDSLVPNGICSFDEALSDFQSAVQLDGSLSSAHTNAGLIMMNHRMKPRCTSKCYVLCVCVHVCV